MRDKLNILIKRGSKNVYLKLLDSKTLRISVPSFYTDIQIQRVLARHKDWLSNALHRIRAQDEQIASAQYYGEKLLCFGEWRNISTLGLENLLKEFLDEKVKFWADRMGIKIRGVCIKYTKSYFGQCRHNDELYFSLMLAFAPKECIEYVIIHELAHVKHKNHSKEFWNLVARFSPNFASLRMFLRSNARLYVTLLERIKD